MFSTQHIGAPAWVPRGLQFLIGTSAIRNQDNVHGINDLTLSNRHKTQANQPVDPLTSHDAESCPGRLIGAPAIRNRNNCHRINHLTFSNRRENRHFRPTDQMSSQQPKSTPQRLIDTPAISYLSCRAKQAVGPPTSSGPHLTRPAWPVLGPFSIFHFGLSAVMIAAVSPHSGPERAWT